MPPFLVPTKLQVPPLPRQRLSRQRLDALWRDWSDHRLVEVVAGAGYGKTTFLAAAGEHAGRPLLWYSLDVDDRDPAVFLAHLLNLCEGGADGDGAPAVSDREWLARLVNALAARTEGSLLVLDDFHRLGEATEIAGLVERLVRYLPEGHTVVVASREPVLLARPAPACRAGRRA